ncbi:hypothetical protein Pcinc_028857 [Petrolisthes cinctipes]|uniref:Uncharacterized protein n=1 Tax=Petrolisthes cinctipes TaxID=88211 RepID=A0AAE1F266_PETCI|nr:hypothetical protein Pcinc_028857 [Petrolisthes cinctipes]
MPNFTVKDRNYETYNYVGATAKEIDDVEMGESDNTLSSILVRAMQRKARRREIDQAMKIKNLEETKRKLEEEKRRCKDERKKQEVKLREMKEAHRLRLMREEQWRERQIKLARQTKLADEFQKMTLIRYYFQGFKMLVEINRSNQRKAKYHYRQRIMQKAFSKLVINKEQEQLWKNRMASGFHNVTLLNKFFFIWKEVDQFKRDVSSEKTDGYSSSTPRAESSKAVFVVMEVDVTRFADAETNRRKQSLVSLPENASPSRAEGVARIPGGEEGTTTEGLGRDASEGPRQRHSAGLLSTNL